MLTTHRPAPPAKQQGSLSDGSALSRIHAHVSTQHVLSGSGFVHSGQHPIKAPSQASSFQARSGPVLVTGWAGARSPHGSPSASSARAYFQGSATLNKGAVSLPLQASCRPTFPPLLGTETECKDGAGLAAQELCFPLWTLPTALQSGCCPSRRGHQPHTCPRCSAPRGPPVCRAGSGVYAGFGGFFPDSATLVVLTNVYWAFTHLLSFGPIFAHLSLGHLIVTESPCVSHEQRQLYFR